VPSDWIRAAIAAKVRNLASLEKYLPKRGV
jgi:hypothetical protein